MKIEDVAAHFRQILNDKKYVLLFAYNGTGKTRLSMAFKDMGRNGEDRDTLYFNAFTEDLFNWDNDLDGDQERKLELNQKSRFFSGLQELEMENRIRPLLRRYTDFDFVIDYKDWSISFFRDVENEKYEEGSTDPAKQNPRTMIENIKVSRGEENIFIWCFFIAVVELAMDTEIQAYNWVKYIYIDDPISSLDEHNAIAVANNLGQMLKNYNGTLKTIISTHHPLFFNVMYNELGKAKKFFLSQNKKTQEYILQDTGETPFFHHVATLADLYKAEQSGELYTYHFNILRTLLEKSASFHGFKGFSACIKQDDDDPDGIFHARLLNILSHGNYSLFEPQEMLPENKEYFGRILRDFLGRYDFNPEIFPNPTEETTAA